MKSPTIPSSDIFRKAIEEYSKIYEISECLYIGTMKEFSIKELDKLTEIDAKRILEPFLITWGRMSRVLGKNGCDIVRLKIIELSDKLEKYRLKNLLDFNIDVEEKHLSKIFNDIKNTKVTSRDVGPTATSKILHIINPQLFPMWDTKIRGKFRLYYGSASDYIDFMTEAKRWLSYSELKPELETLSNRYQKSKLKILDQYNWYIAWHLDSRTRPHTNFTRPRRLP